MAEIVDHSLFHLEDCRCQRMEYSLWYKGRLLGLFVWLFYCRSVKINESMRMFFNRWKPAQKTWASLSTRGDIATNTLGLKRRSTISIHVTVISRVKTTKGEVLMGFHSWDCRCNNEPAHRISHQRWLVGYRCTIDAEMEKLQGTLMLRLRDYRTYPRYSLIQKLHWA